jgi:broad specificity phosphatase PhoE
MRLILIRHCKTLFNVSGQIMGWGDSPHAEDWLEDVVFIENTLQKADFTPDIVYSSALGRARHTGDYFAAKLGQGSAHHHRELNEVNYGSLTEKPKKWVAAHYPLHKKDPDFIYPDGESFRQMQQRSGSFINELAQKHSSGNILCVVHAGVIRALVSHFLELDFGHQLKRRISHRYIGVLSFEEGVCRDYEELGKPSDFVIDEAIPAPRACS